MFSSGNGKDKQDDWELVDGPNTDLVGTKSSRMILRDKDLIVASGPEVRMCSLAGDAWKVDGRAVGTYKVSSVTRNLFNKLMLDAQVGMSKFSSRVASPQSD